MDIKTYVEKSLKERIMHISLPSGLEFDLILPTPYEYTHSENETILDFIGKRLPEGLKLSDLLAPDYFAFAEIVSNFFEKEKTYLSGLGIMPKTQ